MTVQFVSFNSLGTLVQTVYRRDLSVVSCREAVSRVVTCVWLTLMSGGLMRTLLSILHPAPVPDTGCGLSLPVCLISYLKLLWKELPVTFADDIFLETLSIPIKQILLKHCTCTLHIRDISALVSVCFHYVRNLTCFVEIFLINIFR